MFSKAILKISRELDGVKFLESDFSEELESKIIFHVARGSPIGSFMKSITIDEIVFFQYFEGSSEEAHILLAGVDKLSLVDNILCLKPTEKLLNNSTVVSRTFKLPNLNKSMEYFSKVEGLEGLLFTFFTNLKLVILGSEENNLETILHALQFIPPEIAKNQSFCSYSENLDEDVTWFGMPATKESLEKINGLELTHTIFSTTKMKCMTPFSCEILNTLANHIKCGDYNKAKKLMLKILQNSRDVIHLKTAEEISDHLECSLEDADFYLKTTEVISGLSDLSDPDYWR
jgi:hypothetical protein